MNGEWGDYAWVRVISRVRTGGDVYTHVHARAVYARAVAWTSASCVRVGACVAVTFAVGHPADEYRALAPIVLYGAMSGNTCAAASENDDGTNHHDYDGSDTDGCCDGGADRGDDDDGAADCDNDDTDDEGDVHEQVLIHIALAAAADDDDDDGRRRLRPRRRRRRRRRHAISTRSTRRCKPAPSTTHGRPARWLVSTAAAHQSE